MFTEITVSEDTGSVSLDVQQYFEDGVVTFALENNDSEILTSGSIDGCQLTPYITAGLTGTAGVTIRRSHARAAFSDMFLTLIVSAAV